MAVLLLFVACTGNSDRVVGDDRTEIVPTAPPSSADETNTPADTGMSDLDPSPSAWGSCMSLRSLLVVAGTGTQILDSVATAPDATRFVSATSSEPLTLGAGTPSEVTLTPLSYSLGVLARFDAADAVLWAVPFDGSQGGAGGSLALQPDGGVVVGGSCDSTTVLAAGALPAGCPTFGGFDAWLVKFDAAGAVAWTRGFGGPGQDWAGSLFALPEGGFVVAGPAYGDLTFGLGEPTETTLTMPHGVFVAGYVARYTGDGDLVWAQGYGGAEIVEPYNVDYDPLVDAVTVVGVVSGTGLAVWGTGPDKVTVDPAGDESFVAWYAGDGSLQWVETAGGTGATGVAVTHAPGGETVATGYFSGTVIFGRDDDHETSVATQGFAMWTARYEADGDLAWVTSADSGDATSLGRAVSPTGDRFLVAIEFEDVIVLGRGTSSEMVFRGSSSLPWETDTVLAVYDPDGAFVCGVQVESIPSSDFPTPYQMVNNIAERPDGGFDLYGLASGVVRFGSGTAAEVELDADYSDAYVATIDVVAP